MNAKRRLVNLTLEPSRAFPKLPELWHDGVTPSLLNPPSEHVRLVSPFLPFLPPPPSFPSV